MSALESHQNALRSQFSILLTSIVFIMKSSIIRRKLSRIFVKFKFPGVFSSRWLMPYKSCAQDPQLSLRNENRRKRKSNFGCVGRAKVKSGFAPTYPNSETELPAHLETDKFDKKHSLHFPNYSDPAATAVGKFATTVAFETLSPLAFHYFRPLLLCRLFLQLK